MSKPIWTNRVTANYAKLAHSLKNAVFDGLKKMPSCILIKFLRQLLYSKYPPSDSISTVLTIRHVFFFSKSSRLITFWISPELLQAYHCHLFMYEFCKRVDEAHATKLSLCGCPSASSTKIPRSRLLRIII